MKTKDARSFTAERKEKMRIKACHLMRRYYYYKPIQMAEELGVSRQSVDNWLKASLKGGRKALRSKKKGRPREITLSKLRTAQINRLILDNTPDQLNLPFYLWNREAFEQLANKHLKLNLSMSTLIRYLKLWNYIPYEPSPRRFCQDIKFDIEFFKKENEFIITKDYHSIYNRAKREKATIFWCDINPLRYDYPITPTYDSEGNPIDRLNLGRRIKFSTISAITNKGVVHFKVFRQKINPDLFLEFIQRLIKQVGRSVYILMKRHRVHRFKVVKKWLEDNSGQICLFPISYTFFDDFDKYDSLYSYINSKQFQDQL